ncbi:MAG TPA: efflux RND transporter permease subunit [Candidatus Sulfotelmatobacter sp.]|nr:efflux RND transporter permease subunit [Candidatus Sulfotelmatobacter sp.]
MAAFSLRHPYFIIVICTLVMVLGVTSLVQMPVDMFPPINIPVVTVATFYNGMPPEQIEADITDTFERFFTLGSSIDHMESRSLAGVSLVKVYFQPGTSANADVTQMANLAMADLKRLPEGTLPPVVLSTGAATLPVCMLTVEGKGLDETRLHDYLQYQIRDQIAGVPGATVPPPFGGKYRQVMVYVDPLKLQANQLSPMDVVRATNSSNVILPAGDVRIGPLDYDLYTNAQVGRPQELNDVPVKTEGDRSVFISDIGRAVDGSYLQYNIVRVNQQKSVYVPVMKQGGDTNTISVVNGIKKAIKTLRDIPPQLKSTVVFDQSVFVKQAIATVLHEAGIGLVLTAIMILVFLGSPRATAAVFLSIPLSVLATFLFLHTMNKGIDSMVLSGLALAFSRLIDNSVVVLENIFRHLEEGAEPPQAAENGTNEVALSVLAITLVTVFVFFPVTLLYGVSKFLFTALALGVVISLISSYFVAISVVPLYCSNFLRRRTPEEEVGNQEPQRRRPSFADRFHAGFNSRFERMLNHYDVWLDKALQKPKLVLLAFLGFFLLCFALYPLVGVAFYPRTDQGQFVINVKAPTGTRIEVTNKYVKKVEDVVKQIVKPADLHTIVSNIGVMPDFSALFTSNSAMHTAFVQVGLTEKHKTSSFQYMDEVRKRLSEQLPELRTFFQSGGLIDAVLNQGVPAPIDIQVSGMNLGMVNQTALEMQQKIKNLPDVADVYIPQDMDYPGLQLNVKRDRASELGLTPKEVVDNVITSLTSDVMIAPSYWVDARTGNNYFVTVQYPENRVQSIEDLRSMPLRAPGIKFPTYLEQVADIKPILSPTEIDHYQLERIIDLYVVPKGEDLGKPQKEIAKIIAQSRHPSAIRMDVRGLVTTMQTSFKSFGIGLLLSVLLVYIILVAQFSSFIDPLLIILAVPTGLIGVIFALAFTDTTLNIQSLMGIIMLTGMVVSNSILIVDFANRARTQEHDVRKAVANACRVRLRPILMTSLATIVGLLPMALKLETGSEAYAPLARVIIGGLLTSVILTVFIVPAAYFWTYQHRAR